MLKRTLAIWLTVSATISATPDWSPHARLSERKNTTIYVASVQFPAIIKELPTMRAYFAGKKITCEVDGDRLLFTIETERNMRKLYILVVEDNSFKYDETVQYLRVKPGTPYKFWSLELVHKKNNRTIAPKLVGGIKLNQDETSPYFWIIHEETIDEATGRIPDNTMILRYHPSFVGHLEESDSSVNLPTLVIVPNILKLVGSEKNLHEISTRYILSALDYCDTIHDRQTYAIEQHKDVNRISIIST